METLVSNYFRQLRSVAWVETAVLLFSDQAANGSTSGRQDGKLSIYMVKAATREGRGLRTSRSSLYEHHYIMLMGPTASPRSRGAPIICARGDRQLVRIEKDGKPHVLVDNWQGKKMPAPNTSSSSPTGRSTSSLSRA